MVGHALPTRRVVADFGPIVHDNRRILAPEWLAEAITMWGLAALVIVVTAVGRAGSDVAHWVYRVVAGSLFAFAVLTAMTGARTPVVWFKICPVLLTGSAVLLVLASQT